MKSYATPFAIVGSLLTAALFVVLNMLTTPGVLWSVYPVYALAWWPVGVYLCRAKMYMAFSIAGSLLTIAFLAVTNILMFPQTLWFLYAIPPLLLWPVAMYLKRSMLSMPGAALIMSALIIAYFTVINLLLTPGRFWAIYPIYFALWWPLGLYFTGRGYHKAFSIIGAALTIAFLIASNLVETAYPWALYACYPVVWWPVAMCFGKRLGGFKFSLVCSVCTLAWYGALNILLAPAVPWVMFVAYGLLWWLLSVTFYGRRRPHIYAAIMSAISIAFFIAVNAIFSPGAIWAVYPVFAVLWWPMTLLFARRKAWRGYSLAATALTVIFLFAVNLITSPLYPWSVFPSLGIIWWPLCMCFKGKHSPFAFALCGTLLTTATLVTINLITSPGFLWSAFPVPGLLWWPLAAGFAGKRKPFAFSVCSALLVIATLAAVNLITSPGFLWSVFAALAVLWWPAAVFFAKKKSAFGFSVAGSLLAVALLASINVMTSPSFPWCVFAVFAVLWWPLSVYFHYVRRRRLTGQNV